MSNRAVGIDVGTMFYQTAELDVSGGTAIKIVRNCFVELSKTEDIHEMLKQQKFQYVEDDKNIYVIGEDAIRFARMLPGKVELRRPLQDGVLNKDEDMKMLVLNEIIRSTVGKAPDKKSVIATCVSSPPVDGAPTNTFHERRLRGMFENQGWNVSVIEEGLAVILSENPTSQDSEGNALPFTGIGVSFGAGRVNIVVAYKGLVAAGMSAARSGDWIDKEVSAQINLPVAQVTAFKETKLDFDKINEEDDLQFALDAYYSEMLRWVFTQFSKKFKEAKGQSECPLDIVVAGGTSMPKGFVAKLDRVVRELELPFEIKNIRHAQDPRNAVCKGLLTKAMLAQKELQRKDSPDEILKT